MSHVRQQEEHQHRWCDSRTSPTYRTEIPVRRNRESHTASQVTHGKAGSPKEQRSWAELLAVVFAKPLAAICGAVGTPNGRVGEMRCHKHEVCLPSGRHGRITKAMPSRYFYCFYSCPDFRYCARPSVIAQWLIRVCVRRPPSVAILTLGSACPACCRCIAGTWYLLLAASNLDAGGHPITRLQDVQLGAAGIPRMHAEIITPASPTGGVSHAIAGYFEIPCSQMMCARSTPRPMHTKVTCYIRPLSSGRLIRERTSTLHISLRDILFRHPPSPPGSDPRIHRIITVTSVVVRTAHV